ncbi:serine/threonine-protein kinase [Methanoculleus sp.]|uniref:serine/threonine-protein kinase n=1 Tax=Methanoculleus sp. TaxID=90427 RepID=UPI0025FACDE9|nr:serine/threonine-protein kinase [Methanoculleus sp.]
MRPERATVLLLAAALLLAAIAPAVSGAGGPPGDTNGVVPAIGAAGKAPADDVTTAPGKSGLAPGQNKDKGKGKPKETPSPLPSLTPAGTPGEEQAGRAGEEGSGPTVADFSGWGGIGLGLILLAGAAVLGARYLMEPEERGAGGETRAGATILPGAYRTQLSRPAGFPPELGERYDRIAFVGRGGLGQVFSAVRRDDRRTVAVKIPVTYDEATGKTFMKEMRFWEDLVHPNIVQVYSVNILPVPYVEMEYLPRSLADLDKPLPVGTAARIAAGIAAGLAYAHERGVVHRDIKPGNILLADDLTPKITDWGMSTRLATSRETGAAGFTLAYAAPEQIAPERFGKTGAGAGTDIYQLGAVLYELVTGMAPYAGEGIAGMAGAILNGQPVPPSEVDPALARLDGIILRCLAKEPADRYRSAREVLDAINAVTGGEGDEGS